jgi:hypothetical protein
MRKNTAFITVVVLLFSSGCGVVSLMGTPTSSEKKIPAEFNLAAQKDKKVVVIVDNPAWVNAPPALATRLAADLTASLTAVLLLPPQNIIPYGKTQSLSAEATQAGPRSPVEMGKTAGADLVLFAELHEFTLAGLTETEYYKGELAGSAALFDCASGKQLWPASQQGKIIRVGFDLEKSGYTAADNRLAAAFAHCVTRYLYDCPVAKFKIADDRSGAGWENWQD